MPDHGSSRSRCPVVPPSGRNFGTPHVFFYRTLGLSPDQVWRPNPLHTNGDRDGDYAGPLEISGGRRLFAWPSVSSLREGRHCKCEWDDTHPAPTAVACQGWEKLSLRMHRLSAFITPHVCLSDELPETLP